MEHVSARKSIVLVAIAAQHLWGCSSPSVHPRDPRSAQKGAVGGSLERPGTAAAAGAEETPAANPTRATAGGGEGSALAPGRSVRDGRAADPSRGLPEVSIRHVGMHIGGESNSAESKKPFLKAIEARTTELLRCYRYVREPMQGGTFGADLRVVATGGAPEVTHIRQRMGDQDFESCMAREMAGVRFDPPGRATTLSYSLRFDIGRSGH